MKYTEFSDMIIERICEMEKIPANHSLIRESYDHWSIPQLLKHYMATSWFLQTSDKLDVLVRKVWNQIKTTGSFDLSVIQENETAIEEVNYEKRS